MSKISFEGIGEVVATFACEEGVTAGQVVKITADGTVGPCAAGEKFCGVALSAQDGYAAVQLGGLVEAPVTGEGVTAGWCRLSADGSGGIKADAAATTSGDGGGTTAAGGEYLVVWVESGGAVIRL